MKKLILEYKNRYAQQIRPTLRPRLAERCDKAFVLAEKDPSGYNSDFQGTNAACLMPCIQNAMDLQEGELYSERVSAKMRAIFPEYSAIITPDAGADAWDGIFEHHSMS